MHNAEALLDIHTRAHETLRRLIIYCGNLTAGELRRSLSGFGFPTVLGQLEHTIGAEVYWQTVVTKGYSEEATRPDVQDLVRVEAFREATASVTRLYLEHATEAELNAPRRMVSDPGHTRVLRPADAILRIVTHMFSHQGQVLAMCRTLGKRNETFDMDYPVD